MDNYREKTFQFEDLMSKILRLKNVNNNSQEASCCELNGCHAMKPRDVQGEQPRKFSDDDDAVIKEIPAENGVKESMAAGRLREEEDPIVAGRRSSSSNSNDSTDNLSEVSDDNDQHDVDVVLLDNQPFADDDFSENSDDCVYAYRGADFDILEYRNNNVEDETDFLEMDFEPDPASEIESANECRAMNFNHLQHHHDNSLDEFALPLQILDDANHKPKTNANEEFNSTRNHNISDDEDGEHFRVTGAKPKKQLTDKPTGKLPMTQRKQSSPLPVVQPPPLPPSNTKVETVPGRNHMSNGDAAHSDDAEETCIDCLENEFLSKTIGRKFEPINCRKCRRAISQKFESREPEIDCFSLDFTADCQRILQKPSALETQRDSNTDSFAPVQHAENVNLLKRIGKESVTFSSVNVDEKVIIQALDHINIDFNKDIIKKHFEAMHNEYPHFDNVTDLILYISKRNCDYKKIIKLIVLACNEEIDIKFTRDENVSKETEIVQVRSCDILETWTIQSNLDRLKKLNRKFVQMNVLGKVINLIRHAQQRNTKSTEEFIVVPQYYKTGYICITKK